MAYMKPQGYWQKSIWADGRTTTVYIGKGEGGRQLAEGDRRRCGRARAERAERDRDDPHHGRLRAAEESGGTAVRRAGAACLRSLGYDRQCRHSWRIRPMGRDELAPRVVGAPTPDAVRALLE